MSNVFFGILRCLSTSYSNYFAESQVREIHAKDVDLLEKSGSESEQDIEKLLQL